MMGVLRHPALHFALWRMGLVQAHTETTSAERECLCRHAAGRHVLVEIGVWHGVTTRLLRSAMADEGILYAVDPFPYSRLGICWEERIARCEASRAARGTVRFLKMTSADAAFLIPTVSSQLPDFVFLDGDHSYGGLLTDWKLWTTRIRPGAILALHDSRSYHGRNIDQSAAVRFTRHVAVTDSRFSVIECADSITVLRRNLE